MNRPRVACAASLLAVVAPVALASAAAAHEPVFVTEADPTPTDGPFLEDGNHSWAVYGTLPTEGATRGFRSRLTRGQTLIADLLVPDREPERSFTAAQLPVLTLTWPDGTSRTFTSREITRFDEPFSSTRYIRIAELREPASQDGVYTFSVRANVPARFTVATGTVEGFGGAKSDVETPPEGGLAAWYATPPVPPSTTGPANASSTSGTAPTTASNADDNSSSLGWVIGAIAAGMIVVFGVIARRRRS